jgi:hypothetical protein
MFVGRPGARMERDWTSYWNGASKSTCQCLKMLRPPQCLLAYGSLATLHKEGLHPYRVQWSQHFETSHVCGGLDFCQVDVIYIHTCTAIFYWLIRWSLSTIEWNKIVILWICNSKRFSLCVKVCYVVLWGWWGFHGNIRSEEHLSGCSYNVLFYEIIC